MERNKRLAEALQIDSSSDPFNVRSTSVYSDSLKEDARSVYCAYLLPAIDLLQQLITFFCADQIQMQINHHLISVSLFSFRKDLKFVTEVEEEIKNLAELANKVRGYSECLYADPNSLVTSHVM